MGFPHDEISGSDETLLVCKRNLLTLAYRLHRRAYTDASDKTVDDNVSARGSFYQAIHPRYHRNINLFRQNFSFFLVIDRYKFRGKLIYLLLEQLYIILACQSSDAVTLALCDLKRLPANASCASKNRERFHLSISIAA